MIVYTRDVKTLIGFDLAPCLFRRRNALNRELHQRTHPRRKYHVDKTSGKLEIVSCQQLGWQQAKQVKLAEALSTLLALPVAILIADDDTISNLPVCPGHLSKFSHCQSRQLGTFCIPYGRYEVSVSKSWPRDAVLECLGLVKIWDSFGLKEKKQRSRSGASFYKLCSFSTTEVH